MDHVVAAVTPPDAAADALLALQAALAELSEVIHANWVVSVSSQLRELVYYGTSG